MSRREQKRAQITRSELVNESRRLFARKGYEAVSIDDIATNVGVTKGAVYHHFPEGKRQLFHAVVERVEEALLEDLASSPAPGGGAWDQVKAGCAAYLDACLRRDVQQTLLVDAPAVLGWAEWRAIDMRYGFGMMTAGMQAAQAEGKLKPVDVRSAAHLVLAALCEAALLIGNSKDAKAARAAAGETVSALLNGLEA